jgi:hypothetical protein
MPIIPHLLHVGVAGGDQQAQLALRALCQQL